MEKLAVMKRASRGSLQDAGVSEREQEGLALQAPSRWHSAGCICCVLGNREVMSAGVCSPVTPLPSPSSQNRRCGAIICLV